jgi:hypothetical protein
MPKEKCHVKLTRLDPQADAENRPMYLESSSVANVALYMKFGFEVKREIFLKRGEVPVQLSIMVREPQQAPRKVTAYPRAGTVVGTVKLQGAAATGMKKMA